MWSALSIPTAGVYLPFYFGLNEVPAAYGTGSQDDGAAHFTYKELYRVLQSDDARDAADGLHALETRILENQREFEESMMGIYTRDRRAARDALTEHIHDLADQALTHAKAAIAGGR
jgi:dipeptidase